MVSSRLGCYAKWAVGPVTMGWLPCNIHQKRYSNIVIAVEKQWLLRKYVKKMHFY